jgi:hypothetical protein
MDLPSCKHTVRDEANNVTYHVMAYRRLTRAEVMQGVSFYLSQPQQRRRKKPVRDKVITIFSSIGCGVR